MKYVIGLILGVSLVCPLPSRAQTPPPLLLSEVAWAGSARSTADEWLELFNSGDGDVALGGWSIAGIGTSGSVITLPPEAIIPSKGTYLIANYKRGEEKTTLDVEPDLVTSAVSIPNDGLKIILLSPAGEVVDMLDDAGKPEFGSSITFASAERDLKTLEWKTTDTSFNLLDEQHGNPGDIELPTDIEDAFTIDPLLTPEENPLPDSGASESLPLASVEEEGAATEETQNAEEDNEEEISIESDTELQNHEVEAEEEVITEPKEEISAEVDTKTPVVTEEDAFATPQETEIDEPLDGVLAEGSDTVIDNASSSERSPDESVLAEGSDTLTESDETNETTASVIPVVTPVEEINPTADESSTENTSTVIEDDESVEEAVLPPKTHAVGALLINELVSDPTDLIEWIELYNPGNETMSLDGWTIVDASEKATMLTGTIDAKGFLIVENPNGKLNNTSETVILRDPSGLAIDAVGYGGESPYPKKGESLIRYTDGTLALSKILTRGATNPSPEEEPTEETTYATSATSTSAATEEDELPATAVASPQSSTSATQNTDGNSGTESAGAADSGAPVGASVKTPTASAAATKKTTTNAKTSSASTKKSSSSTSSKKSASTSKKAAQTITKESLASLAAGDPVIIEGSVVALPGAFGKQLMYVDGVEVYMNAGKWPELRLGDRVRVEGEISETKGIKRIKITNAEAITVLQQGVAEAKGVESLNDIAHGSLVSIAGTITGREGDEMTVKTDAGESITVVAQKSAGVTFISFGADRVTVTGIVRRYDNAITLLPRSMEDIKTITKTDASAALSSTEDIGPSTNEKNVTGFALLGLAVGSLSLAYVRHRFFGQTDEALDLNPLTA